MIYPSAYETIKPPHIDNDTYENAKNYALRDINGLTLLAYRDLPQLIKKYVTGKRALDFGCGTGFSTRLLNSLDFDVSGVDISLNMLSHALAKKDGIPYAHIKHAQINAQPNTFDLVLSVMVYLDIPSLKMIEEIQSEIHRILKPGAIFMAVVGSDHLHVNNWSTTVTDVSKNRTLKSGDIYEIYARNDGITFYDYIYSDDDYRKVFTKTGFNIINIHQPLGNESDGYQWDIEKTTPAHTIYVCQKISNLFDANKS